MLIENIINDKERILKLTHEASKDTHKNASNYKNFEKRLDNTIAFHVAYFVDVPVAFAAMYQSPKWPSNIVRICDRTFYFKEARTSAMSFWNNKEIKATASKYFIPEQTKLALKNNLTPFYSIEKISRRKALIRQVELVNQYYDFKYYVLPGMYWTCNSPVGDNEKCWQSVATLESSITDIKLPSKSLSYFINRKF